MLRNKVTFVRSFQTSNLHYTTACVQYWLLQSVCARRKGVQSSHGLPVWEMSDEGYTGFLKQRMAGL